MTDPAPRHDLLDGPTALAAVPPPVLAIVHALEHAGGRAFLVGGTVRDLLLGGAPVDFDVATDLPPERTASLLPGGAQRDLHLGAFRVDGLPWPLTVTTLRTEGEYTDRRRPRHVQFVADPALDSARRDFTVNAIYLDARGVLTDPTGGLADLRARVLRTIGDPDERLAEDVLRLLRLVRFAARHGLHVDDATAAAARRNAPLLAGLAAERTFDELTRAFSGPGRGRALRLLVELGLAAVVLPEAAALDGVPQPPQFHPEGDVLTHTCLVLDNVPAADPVLAWSAVLHDVGKPPTLRVAEDRIRFDGHDTLSAAMADAVLRRLRAPAALRDRVVEICRDHIRFASLPRMRPARRERWLRSPGFDAHLAFHRADCLASHGDLTVHDVVAAELRALPPRTPPLVTGADVLALGVAPGPRVGELLRAVQLRIDEEDAMPATRERALSWLRDLAAGGVKHDSAKDDRERETDGQPRPGET